MREARTKNNINADGWDPKYDEVEHGYASRRVNTEMHEKAKVFMQDSAGDGECTGHALDQSVRETLLLHGAPASKITSILRQGWNGGFSGTGRG